jgi:archaellum component FlaC
MIIPTDNQQELLSTMQRIEEAYALIYPHIEEVKDDFNQFISRYEDPDYQENMEAA